MNMKISQISFSDYPFQPRPTAPSPPPQRLSGWEYIVDDFMEMACFLSEEKRLFLIEEMRLSRKISDAMEVHPSFTMDKNLVVVIDGPKVEECWLYYPQQKKIEKYVVGKRNAGAL